MNEGTRRLLAKEGQSPADLPALHIITAAGAAGILFWLLVYPTDVIKVCLNNHWQLHTALTTLQHNTPQQSSIQADSIDKSKRKYKGIIDCAQQMYKEGGWRRFFSGLTPCLLRAVPANAGKQLILFLSFSLYLSLSLSLSLSLALSRSFISLICSYVAGNRIHSHFLARRVNLRVH